MTGRRTRRRRRATPPSSTSVVAPRDLLARMAPRRRRASAPSARTTRCRRRASAGVVCGCMGTTVADLESALGSRLHRHRAAQARELGRARAVPGRRLPAAPPGVRRRPHRRRPGAVHRPPRRPPDHARRGRRRRHDRRLPADAAPRRAPRARRADGPVRRLVAAVALRRRASPSTARSASGSRSATSRRSASSSCPGPDVVEALERLYPCHVADIKPGRSRYALLLNERGHVMDDGMILRESETRFALTLHVRRRGQRRDVGPRLGRDVGPPRPRHGPDDVARRDQRHGAAGEGAPRARRARRAAAVSSATPTPRSPACPCHVMRLSFTGEASFELHHPIDRSVELWRALMDLGADMDIAAARAPGAVRAAAREGPRDRRDGHRARHDAGAGSGWTGRSGWRSRSSSAGPRSSGRRSCRRRGAGSGSRWMARRRPRARRSGPDGEIVGNVTGSWTSPVARQGADPRLAEAGAVPGRGRDRRPPGGRDADAVLRPGGHPCPRLSRSPGSGSSRIAAALDARPLVRRRRGHGPAVRARTRRSRSARQRVEVDDEHAIVEPEPGFSGARLDSAGLESVLAHVEFALPRRAPGPRPGQGRRRPGEAAARRRRRAARRPDRLRRRPRGAPPVSAQVESLQPHHLARAALDATTS